MALPAGYTVQIPGLCGSACWLRCAALCLSLLFSAAASEAATVSDSVDPFGFRQEQYSSWGLVDAGWPYEGRHGCWPVGNGLCFAHLGVDSDFNTLRGITGPGYQTRDSQGKAVYWQEGDWPDMQVHLLGTDGLPLRWDKQSIQVVKGCAMLRTKCESKLGTLWGLSYAVPDNRMILREFVFAPADRSAAKPSSLRVEMAGGSADGVQLGFSKGDKLLVLSAPWQPAHADTQGLSVSGLEGGDGSLSWTCVLDFCSPQSRYDSILPQEPGSFRRICQDYWQDWSADNPRSNEPRLDDLLLQLPVIIETQRDRASGGVSPMVSYHGYWVRDSMGPILTYLMCQRTAEVRKMLEYHRKACWRGQTCSMLWPLDVDVSNVVEGDWSAVPVEHAEVPSLIVLEHYWYWKTTLDLGKPDTEFLKEAWPFLWRNLTAMPVDDDYGVRFHGDETYTQGALYSSYDFDATTDGAAPGSGSPLGYPNGYIPTEFFSLDNTALHLNAVAALQEMAAEIQGVQPYDAGALDALKAKLDLALEQYRDTQWIAPAISPLTGQLWPWPFSNISYGQYWPILQHPIDPLYIAADPGVAHALMLPPPASTPASGYHTGHNLSTYCSAAVALKDMKLLAAGLNQLMEEAWPDGAWCEVYDGQGQPVNVYGRINRIRPWESGINYYTLVLNAGTERKQMPVDAPAYSPPGMPIPPKSTKLLVISRDNHYKEALEKDYRLGALPSTEICPWDVALPFGVQDLRNALLSTGDAPGLRTPFLYLDRDVRIADRRSFKSAAFWQSAELQALLDEYRASGGTVLEEADLRPAWSFGYAYRSNRKGLPPIHAPFDPGLELSVDGPPGEYHCSLRFTDTKTYARKRLLEEGVLAQVSLPDTELDLSRGQPAWIEMNPQVWQAAQFADATAQITFRQPDGTMARFVHPLPRAFPFSYELSQVEADRLPDWIVRAWPIPAHDNDPFASLLRRKALTIDIQNGHVFNGSKHDLRDFQAEIRMGYDSQNLYVLGQVRGAANRRGLLWSCDRFNLVFDASLDSTTAAYPSGPVGKEEWQPDDYWLILAPFAEEAAGSGAIPQTWRIGGSAVKAEGGWDEASRGFYGQIDAGWSTFPESEKDGYSFHWTIPLAELPFLRAEARSFAGLSVFYTSMGEELSEIMFPGDWGGTGGIEWRFWDCGLLYFEP